MDGLQPARSHGAGAIGDSEVKAPELMSSIHLKSPVDHMFGSTRLVRKSL